MKKVSAYLWLVVIAQGLMLILELVGQFYFLTYWDGTAPNNKAHADVRGGLSTVLGMFKDDCGRYPTAAEGLKILVELPKGSSLKNWRGPYFDPPEIPKDPWGHEYIYRFPAIYSTNGYDLYSLGFDGVSKTGGNDYDDIGNWDRPSSPTGEEVVTKRV